MIKKFISDKKRNIFVLDNYFEIGKSEELFVYARNSYFQCANSDHDLNSTGVFDSKWRCNLTDENVKNIGLSTDIVKDIFKIPFKNIKKLLVSNHYINYSDTSTIDRIHVDKTSVKPSEGSYYTMLIYAQSQWHYDWGGETKFYNNDLTEIALSVIPKPGRIVIFDGQIPHSASVPNRLAKEPRYTYAIKYNVY
jgi:hypothetical protein